MCNEYSMLRKNSNIGLMQANTAAYIFIYLFVSRHEVHSRNTHTLQNAG